MVGLFLSEHSFELSPRSRWQLTLVHLGVELSATDQSLSVHVEHILYVLLHEETERLRREMAQLSIKQSSFHTMQQTMTSALHSHPVRPSVHPSVDVDRRRGSRDDLSTSQPPSQTVCPSVSGCRQTERFQRTTKHKTAVPNAIDT